MLQRRTRGARHRRLPRAHGVGRRPRSRRDHRRLRRRRARAHALGRGAGRRARQDEPGSKRWRSSNSDSPAPWAATLRAQRLALGALAQRLQISHPGAKLAQHAQRLDDLEQRLRLALRASVLGRAAAAGNLEHAAVARESASSARSAVRARGGAAPAAGVGHSRGSSNALEQRLALASRTLDAVSPLATLGRGFAVVSRVDDGALLRDAAQAPAGTEIEARLAKGRLRAHVVARNRGRR